MAKIFFSIVFALLISQTVKAQDSVITIDNKIYQKYGGVWYFYDPIVDDTFMLNKKIISVKFEESTSSSQINSFLTLMNLPVFVKPIYGWYNLIVDSADDVFTKYLALCESHYIKKCYISTFWKLHATPSDPLFENQWYLQKINIMAAWDITTGDPNIIVGVMDNGIEYVRHIDLNKQTWNWDYSFENNEYENIYNNDAENDWSSWWYPPSGNGIDDDDWDSNPDTYIDDWKGWCFGYFGYGNSPIPAEIDGYQHGSMVAGIIGAKTNNDNTSGYIGIAGIAGGWGDYGCKILALSLGNFLHPQMQFHLQLNMQLPTMLKY